MMLEHLRQFSRQLCLSVYIILPFVCLFYIHFQPVTHAFLRKRFGEASEALLGVLGTFLATHRRMRSCLVGLTFWPGRAAGDQTGSWQDDIFEVERKKGR